MTLTQVQENKNPFTCEDWKTFNFSENDIFTSLEPMDCAPKILANFELETLIQPAIREADRDILEGKITRFESVDEMLASLKTYGK